MYQDKPTLEKIGKAHPKVRGELLAIYNECNQVLQGPVSVRFVFTTRTFAEQDALYAQGRTKPGKIVTNAKAGQSIHNYGLAVDFALLVDKDGNGTYDTVSWDMNQDLDADNKKDWMEVVAIFKKYGWEWGGDWKSFKDYPHFQKTFGHTWQSLKKLYDAKKVDVETFVKI